MPLLRLSSGRAPLEAGPRRGAERRAAGVGAIEFPFVGAIEFTNGGRRRASRSPGGCLSVRSSRAGARAQTRWRARARCGKWSSRRSRLTSRSLRPLAPMAPMAPMAPTKGARAGRATRPLQPATPARSRRRRRRRWRGTRGCRVRSARGRGSSRGRARRRRRRRATAACWASSQRRPPPRRVPPAPAVNSALRAGLEGSQLIQK